MQSKRLPKNEQISEALRLQSQNQFGVLDGSFISQAVSRLGLKDPICVEQEVPVHEVMLLLKENKLGCVLIVDKDTHLKGIFSERDYVIKVYGVPHSEQRPISDFMTPEPVTVQPHDTVAFALNLMSQGGFRHIPLVDNDNCPVGILSVKDVVDSIVSSCLDDLLNFEEVGEGD